MKLIYFRQTSSDYEILFRWDMEYVVMGTNQEIIDGQIKSILELQTPPTYPRNSKASKSD